MKKKANVILITGEIGSGKTTLINAIAARFRETGIEVGGILAPAVYANGVKTGYNIIDISTGDKKLLSQTDEIVGVPQVGKYFFIPEGIDFGRNALSVENNRNAQFVLIDEIGAWELQGQGWASSLNELIINCNMPVIITVRRSFLEFVIENWMLQDPMVIEAEAASVNIVYDEIVKFAGV
jgi:nucleoside-triphosphatase THEP1